MVLLIFFILVNHNFFFFHLTIFLQLLIIVVDFTKSILLFICLTLFDLLWLLRYIFQVSFSQQCFFVFNNLFFWKYHWRDILAGINLILINLWLIYILIRIFTDVIYIIIGAFNLFFIKFFFVNFNCSDGHILSQIIYSIWKFICIFILFCQFMKFNTTLKSIIIISIHFVITIFCFFWKNIWQWIRSHYDW